MQYDLISADLDKAGINNYAFADLIKTWARWSSNKVPGGYASSTTIGRAMKSKGDMEPTHFEDNPEILKLERVIVKMRKICPDLFQVFQIHHLGHGTSDEKSKQLNFSRAKYMNQVKNAFYLVLGIYAQG